MCNVRTNPVQGTDGMALKDILRDPVVISLRRKCVSFFLDASNEKVYKRRPPLALRLPHDDFVIVVKPTTTHCHGNVTVNDRGIWIEVMWRCPDVVGKKFPVRMLSVLVEESARPTMWVLKGHGVKAAEALVEMSKAFLDAPRSVIERNKDHCCCCGKFLRDETSRARGVGPECLTKMGVFFSFGAFQPV